MKFSDAEKAKAAEREVKLRRRVYANRVMTGRMSPEEADYQIEIMAEIAAEYKQRGELPL